MIYGHKISYTIRIAGASLVISVLMIVLPIVTNNLEPDAGFAADISILFVFGIMGGMVQSSTFGLAGMLPPQHMGAVMFGNGISGIIMNAFRVICLLILPPDNAHPEYEFYGALVYFIFASIILVCCAIGLVVFMRLPYVQYYIRKATNEKIRTHRRISGVNNDNDNDSLLGGNNINKSNISG